MGFYLKEYVKRLPNGRPDIYPFDSGYNTFAQLVSNASQENIRDNSYVVAMNDTETTGLQGLPTSQIIELNLTKILVDKDTFKIKALVDSVTMFEEYTGEITSDVQGALDVNHIDLNEIKGEHIDWNKVDEYLSDVDYMCSHNVYFDRYFIDQHSKVTPKMKWICSKADIRWGKYGLFSSKQETIAAQHGFEYDAHRAQEDVNALIHILTHNEEYVKDMISECEKERVNVAAIGKTFDFKEYLKKIGFEWDAEGKVWHCDIDKEKLEEIKDLCQVNVFNKIGAGYLKVTPISNLDRHKM